MNNIDKIIKSLNKNGGVRMNGMYLIKADNNKTLGESLSGKHLVIWSVDGGITIEPRKETLPWYAVDALAPFLTNNGIVSYRKVRAFKWSTNKNLTRWYEVYFKANDGREYQGWVREDILDGIISVGLDEAV